MKKIHHPLFSHSTLKKSKSASPLVANIENFLAPPPSCRKGGRTLCLFEIPLIWIFDRPPYEANDLNLTKQKYLQKSAYLVCSKHCYSLLITFSLFPTFSKIHICNKIVESYFLPIPTPSKT